MGSSYLSLHVHVVFATKRRLPSIAESWRARLHQYIGGVLSGLGAHADAAGGVADHVHVLAGLRSTHSVADLVRDLKKAATLWVQDEIGERSFAWQEGYAAFSVSSNARDAVRNYIANQEIHHRTKTSLEELTEFLQRAGIAYDPKYLE